MKIAAMILFAFSFVTAGFFYFYSPAEKCIFVPGEKGKNGGGDGGSARICGKNGIAIGGKGGNVSSN